MQQYNDNGIRQNFDGLTNDELELISSTSTPGFSTYLKQIFYCSNSEPNRITENIVAFEVFIYCIFCIGVSLCIIYLKTDILNGETWAIIITSIVVGFTVLLVVSLTTQPKSRRDLSFKVPLVPLIPALSIIINIYLMLMLDSMTWVRFGVWMAIGVPMYYACACSRNPTQKLQNGHYRNNITNGTSKDTNGGISNPSFVIKEPNGHLPKCYKKKVAPTPPPTIFESLEVQQEAAIAQLDEILDNEAAIFQLEDTSNNETVRVRKLSIDSLSNVSNIATHCEDVVADVHCANVITPVASSVCFNNVNPDEILPSTNVELVSSDLVQSVNQSNDFMLEDKEQQITILNPNVKGPAEKLGDTFEHKVEESLAIENLIQDQLAAKKVPSALANADKNEEYVIGSENPDSGTAMNADFKAKDFDNTLYPLSKTELYDSAPKVSDRLSLVNAYLTSNEDEDSDQSLTHLNHLNIKELQSPVTVSKVDHLPDPKPLFTISPLKPLETPIPSSRPTEEELKTVTLRHVQRQIKNINTPNNENASEHNLRVGSEEYKNFIRNLDGKLKRLTVLPTFYVPPKKDTNEPPLAVEVKLNENVLDDHIDQAEAKEKLKQFLTKNSDERVGRKLQESVSVVEYSSPNKFTNKNSEENESDLELVDHRKKMENVFKNIKLKKIDAKGEDYLKRRLSKSLGSSFAKYNAQTDHKVKMDDIFKDINAMRKNSIK